MFSHEIISFALGEVIKNYFRMEFGTWPDLGPCPAIARLFFLSLNFFLLLPALPHCR